MDSRTPWFLPHVKPVHVGLYDVALPNFGYWDGERWHYPMEGHIPHFQDFYWRGLNAPQGVSHAD